MKLRVLTYVRSLRCCDVCCAVLFMCFTEQLTDHVFYRYFLNVYVANVAGLKKLPARFRDLCA